MRLKGIVSYAGKKLLGLPRAAFTTRGSRRAQLKYAKGLRKTMSVKSRKAMGMGTRFSLMKTSRGRAELQSLFGRTSRRG